MHRSLKRGIALIILAAALIMGLLLLPKHSSRNAKHSPNNDPWVLVSYDPDNPYGTYLGNGFIGCRIMGEGVGNHDGQPLPCFLAGLYDDEKLIPTPTWSDLRFYDGKTEFKIDKDADYKQVLNMKTGILTTYATWRAGRKTLKGKIEVIVSRAEPNICIVCADFEPGYEGLVLYFVEPKIMDHSLKLIERDQEHQDRKVYIYQTKKSGLYVALAQTLGNRYVNDYIWHYKEDHGGDYVTQGMHNQVAVLSTVSIAPTAAEAKEMAVAHLQSAMLSQKKIVLAHKRAWADLWKRDIIIDGPKKDQQALHSCMFYLLQSVREGSQWSIPPMGLSNNAFSGHVFWDADLWMFPALILQHPEFAKSIVDYRYNTLPGALANAKAHGFTGAEYAWESGLTGREDTPKEVAYSKERHINGGIALCQWQYFLATGDLAWLKTRGYPVLKATADYWVSRVKWIPEKNRYEIQQVVPPDENAELINNSAYTNIIAQMNLQIATEAAKRISSAPNPKWSQVAQKMYIPFDRSSKRFIAFDGYKPNWEAKQADTELIIYPLQYKIGNQSMPDIYKNTFDYYSKRLHKFGPAMSTSAYSVIAARLGQCDRAYSEFINSYKPYLRGPFNYFNEKPSTTYENMCFLTGAAGPIQASVFGLAGAKMDYFAEDNSKILSWSPCLPKQWKSIKLTGVQWRGKIFNITISKGNKVKIDPLPY